MRGSHSIMRRERFVLQSYGQYVFFAGISFTPLPPGTLALDRAPQTPAAQQGGSSSEQANYKERRSEVR